MSTAMITSTSNERVKAIRALRRRKERDASGLAYVEGIRAVREALEADAEVETLLVAPELLQSETAREAVAGASDAGTAVLEVSPAVFRSVSERDGPQGLAAVVRQRWTRLEEIEVGDGERWVALSSVADPGNLGTILRTCDAAGARGVILLDGSADPYDPTAVRASTGAVFTRGLVRASWEAFAAWAASAGVTLVGATDDAEQPYRGADYGSRTVVLMGSEREGLSEAQRAACDRLVGIPMLGSVDSLNLGVATALVLYELLAQRERGG
jgi:TrmH family RNA methyltransferase